jgi:hypothetical protein
MKETSSARAARSRATEPRHATRPPRTPFVLLVLGLIVGGMCALLALNTASAANELSRHDLAARDESVAARVADLENQVAASAAPANLANAAGRLGMVPAGNPAFLVIGKDGKVHVLGSPAPATGAPVYVAPRSSATHPTRTTRKPRPKATKTRTPTKSSTTKSTSSTSTKSATATATRTAAESTPASRAHRTPTPTPTPTPNTTLPGGTR